MVSIRYCMKNRHLRLRSQTIWYTVRQGRCTETVITEGILNTLFSELIPELSGFLWERGGFSDRHSMKVEKLSLSNCPFSYQRSWTTRYSTLGIATGYHRQMCPNSSIICRGQRSVLVLSSTCLASCYFWVRKPSDLAIERSGCVFALHVFSYNVCQNFGLIR